jgi:hypothetical protein
VTTKLDKLRAQVTTLEGKVKAIRQAYLDNPRPSLRDDMALAREELRCARLEVTALRVQAATTLIGNNDKEKT